MKAPGVPRRGKDVKERGISVSFKCLRAKLLLLIRGRLLILKRARRRTEQERSPVAHVTLYGDKIL